MNKVIVVIQSRTTGRFLLKKDGLKWTFPSVADNDRERPVVHEAMERCAKATGMVPENDTWVVEMIDDPIHLIFHMWLDGEPTGVGELEWCSMFMFPEELASITEEVMSNTMLIERALTPHS